MTTTPSELFVDAAVLEEGHDAIVYGAGGVGRDVVRVLEASGHRVPCILDRAASPGDAREGIPIYSLERCPVELTRSDTPVVIAIFNRDVDVPSVARTLRQTGFTKIVPFVRLHAEFAAAFGDRFWLTHRGFNDAHRDDIARAERLLADDRSRGLYRGLIELRDTGRYTPAVSDKCSGLQYVPNDIPGWLGEAPVRFVDCGAYRGDTLEELLDASVPIEASAHFEPDLENFSRLVRVVRQRHGHATASSWPCAVSDGIHQVAFSEGLDEGSRVNAAAAGTVPAVALDDVLVGWRPSFIKMDIEGSEIEALEGARNLIATNRPRLAICVYHQPDHLWRIPLLLASWPFMAGYRYFLRAHGFDGFDTVLYARPDAATGHSVNEVRS